MQKAVVAIKEVKLAAKAPEDAKDIQNMMGLLEGDLKNLVGKCNIREGDVKAAKRALQLDALAKRLEHVVLQLQAVAGGSVFHAIVSAAHKKLVDAKRELHEIRQEILFCIEKWDRDLPSAVVLEHFPADVFCQMFWTEMYVRDAEVTDQSLAAALLSFMNKNGAPIAVSQVALQFIIKHFMLADTPERLREDTPVIGINQVQRFVTNFGPLRFFFPKACCLLTWPGGPSSRPNFQPWVDFYASRLDTERKLQLGDSLVRLSSKLREGKQLIWSVRLRSGLFLHIEFYNSPQGYYVPARQDSPAVTIAELINLHPHVTSGACKPVVDGSLEWRDGKFVGAASAAGPEAPGLYSSAAVFPPAAAAPASARGVDLPGPGVAAYFHGGPS